MTSSNNQPLAGKPAIARNVHVGEAFDLSPQRLAADADNTPQRKLERELDAMRAQYLAQTQAQADALTAAAKQEATRLLAEAKQQAEETVGNAVAQAEADANAARDAIRDAARQEGYDQGYADGFQQGHDEAAAKAVECMVAVQTLAENAFEAKRKVVKGVRRQLAEVMKAVLERIVTERWQADPELLLDVVDKALEQRVVTGKIKVVVGAQAYNALRDWSRETQEAHDRMGRFHWELDAQLGLNDMFIQGEEWALDVGPVGQALRLVSAIEKHLPVEDFIETAPETEAEAGESPEPEDGDLA